MVCLGRLFSIVLLVPVSGNVVGRSAPARPLVAAAWAHTRDVRQSLKEVLDLALGKGAHNVTDVRLQDLSAQLKPLYTALPKKPNGLLGHEQVRYALHRHFIHQHGMYMKGLEPDGTAWDMSSPVDIMEDKVPGYVQHVFEERLHDGFDLLELSLLAGTLEHFVHEEAAERLHSAFKLTGNEIASDSTIGTNRLSDVIDAYMAIFISGEVHHQLTDSQLEKIISRTPELFPSWAQNQAWLRKVEREILQKEAAGDAVTFQIALKVVETIVQRYGKYQNAECRDMKNLLSKGERRGTGRMRLQDFYKSGWQFTETKEYLEELGALDQQYRPAEGPWVVIPNYVVSTANCLASSTLFSVCCMDPCEDILGHLEARVGAPTATPEELIHLVAATPSASVSAPRGLSESLVSHLNEIADTHQGRVPLHGRLFSQWLHHAYPRECVFPILSGTQQPLSPEDWMLHRNESASISDSDKDLLVAELEAVHVKDLADGDMEETLPWDKSEQLIFNHHKPSLAHELRVIGRAGALLGSLYAFIMAMTVPLKSLCSKRNSKSRGLGGLV